MARLRYNGLVATLNAAGLTNTDTTITFTAALTSTAGAVPTISGSDYIPLILLDASSQVKEIVYLTAYTSGATTGTIARAKENTTAVAHAGGVKAHNGPTALDLNGAGCRAFLTTNQTLTTGTVTTLPLAGETFDSAGMHDTVTNNSRITIQVDGDYLVTAAVSHNATSGQVQTRIHKNGTVVALAIAQGTASGTKPAVLDVFQLVAGDYIELGAYQASGSNATVSGDAGGANSSLTVKRML